MAAAAPKSCWVVRAALKLCEAMNGVLYGVGAHFYESVKAGIGAGEAAINLRAQIYSGAGSVLVLR